MNNRINKKVGILGLGMSGKSAINYFKAKSIEIIAWDDLEVTRKRFVNHNILIKDLNNLKNIKLINKLFVSPGIKPNHSVLLLAKKLNIKITGDLDIFWKEKSNEKNRFIFITGSNGKSTVTTMLFHLLKANKYQAVLAGNIGVPVLSLKPNKKTTNYIVEASSYQLALAKELKPNIAILTNITPDHIEWHGSMNKYIAAKEKLFLKQDDNDLAIINIDNKYGLTFFNKLNKKEIKPKIIKISLKKQLDNSIYLYKNNIIDNLNNKKKLIGKIQNLTLLKGMHNVENILSTIAASIHMGLTHDQIREQLPKYEGLPNRLEIIYKDNNLEIINDSKATNLESCKVALSCFNKVIWIAGGRRKKEDFKYLLDNIKNIKAGFFIGESGDDFLSYFNNYFYCENSISINIAIKTAINFSKTIKGKKAILFSPGCSSFDQYKNFEERGNIFKKETHNYINENLR